jgi:hypothetical protein
VKLFSSIVGFIVALVAASTVHLEANGWAIQAVVWLIVFCVSWIVSAFIIFLVLVMFVSAGQAVAPKQRDTSLYGYATPANEETKEGIFDRLVAERAAKEAHVPGTPLPVVSTETVPKQDIFEKIKETANERPLKWD